MINPDIYSFLGELKNNNNKEWFQDNKIRYEACRKGFIQFLEIIIHEISQFDSSIKGQLPKNCLFRINRDIRFSKDKSPYKTNIGAFITPGGRNSGRAGYYIHLEPGSSFLAGGIYMPPSPVLKAIRQEIFENLEEFESIVKNEDFIRHFGEEFHGEKLKTKPKGFPDDFPGLEYLRYKHYTVAKEKTDKEMLSENILNEIIEVFESMYPLNRFLNQVINELS